MSVYFSGMMSGLDTDQLIQNLMALERRPIALMQQKLAGIEAEQSAWRDVNTRLSNLESKVKDLLGSGVFDGMIAKSSDDSVATATATNEATPATYTLQVSDLAQSHVVAGGEVDVGTTVSGGTLTITVGGTSTAVSISDGSTLRDVADAINDADAGVRASVVNVDGARERLVLEGLTTGVDEKVSVTGDTLLTDTGLNGLTQLRGAQDASFTLNGLTITRSTNEISDAIDGVTFTLKKDDAQATITVGQDLDTTVSKIKAVVDQYNSFYTFAQEKLAKEAVLQGDTALIQLTSRVREVLTDRVGTGGGLDQLALIGITTTREGSFTLDESTLREKLAEDPAAVQKLFTAEESTDGFVGVARRAEALIKQYTQSSGLISSRQSMYTGMIDDINDQIDSLEMRLDMREENLRAQFVRMEQMLAQLNAQSNALAGQLAQISSLGSGGGGSAS